MGSFLPSPITGTMDPVLAEIGLALAHHMHPQALLLAYVILWLHYVVQAAHALGSPNFCVRLLHYSCDNGPSSSLWL